MDLIRVKTGMKATMFFINGMAMTSKNEIVIKSYERNGKLTYSFKGKRKVYGKIIKDISLLFEGWDLDIKCDNDGDFIRGNACLNLVTNMSNWDLKNKIDSENLIELSYNDKHSILNFTESQANDSSYDETRGNILYPNPEFHHAVIAKAYSNV